MAEEVVHQDRIMPQDTRMIAILLSFIGGSLDVYCHIRFDALLATQTGNIVLLIADLAPDNWHNTIVKLISMLLFSIGFLCGTYVKDHARTAYWRIWLILPVLIASIILPFTPQVAYAWVAILAYGTGLMMVAFTGSRIETYPFTVLMTSGNYRRMLGSWYRYFIEKRSDREMRHKALSYTIIVANFIAGALTVALLDRLVGDFALWFVSVVFMAIVCYYSYYVYKDHLEKLDI